MITIKQEIILLLIGAAIGFISSIGTTIVAELLKRQGEVKIYYKIVFSKANNDKTWGFFRSENEIIFEVPMWVELQNTSNGVRVIRDLNILLFKDGKQIFQMTQINKYDDSWYGNEGAYSFVLQPRSLKKYDLHFAIKKSEMNDNYKFDEIKLRYFDEKDKKHIFTLKKLKQCWEIGNLNRNDKWKLADN